MTMQGIYARMDNQNQGPNGTVDTGIIRRNHAERVNSFGYQSL